MGKGIKSLHKAIDTDGYEVRQSAYRAIERIGSRMSLKYFVSGTKSTDADIRLSSYKGIGKTKSSIGRDLILRSGIESGEPAIAAAAAAQKQIDDARTAAEAKIAAERAAAAQKLLDDAAIAKALAEAAARKAIADAEAKAIADAAAAREASKFSIEGYSQADNGLNIYLQRAGKPTPQLIHSFPEAIYNWADPVHWVVDQIYPGDYIIFEVASNSGPAGLLAKWTTSKGNTYYSSPELLPCITPDYSTIVATYPWAKHPIFNVGNAQWVWTSNTNNDSGVRRFRWTATA
jgi:hypothetical protein